MDTTDLKTAVNRGLSTGQLISVATDVSVDIPNLFFSATLLTIHR